jgi:hypothetical protein
MRTLLRILQSLRVARVYAGGEMPAEKCMHYFSMNPADGKMVRRKISYGRMRAIKRRR